MIKLEDYKGMFVYGVKGDDEVLVEAVDTEALKEYVNNGYKLFGSKKINIFENLSKEVRELVLNKAKEFDPGLQQFLKEEKEQIELLDKLEEDINNYVKTTRGLGEINVIDEETEITLWTHICTNCKYHSVAEVRKETYEEKRKFDLEFCDKMEAIICRDIEECEYYNKIG